jgi:uncharacterized glyoxalase superfamily protein PhnB
MSDWKPEGWHSVTPRLVVEDVAAEVAFLRAAFQASGEFHAERPAEMLIGDSIVMVSGTGVRSAMPSFLYLYVEDVDAAFARALAAGADAVEEPHDVPYGDRRAMVTDPAGNAWQIATRLRGG